MNRTWIRCLAWLCGALWVLVGLGSVALARLLASSDVDASSDAGAGHVVALIAVVFGAVAMRWATRTAPRWRDR